MLINFGWQRAYAEGERNGIYDYRAIISNSDHWPTRKYQEVKNLPFVSMWEPTSLVESVQLGEDVVSGTPVNRHVRISMSTFHGIPMVHLKRTVGGREMYINFSARSDLVNLFERLAMLLTVHGSEDDCARLFRCLGRIQMQMSLRNQQ